MKLVVLGNSGAGKTTLARDLAAAHDLVHLDLDTVAFEPDGLGTLRAASDVRADLERFADDHAAWVAEGSYADLARALAPRATALIFLNPGIDACLRHHAARPWEPHKYADPAEQEARRAFLEQWVRDYPTRDDQFGLAAHRAVRDGFEGPSIEAPSAEEALAFVRRLCAPEG